MTLSIVEGSKTYEMRGRSAAHEVARVDDELGVAQDILRNEGLVGGGNGHGIGSAKERRRIRFAFHLRLANHDGGYVGIVDGYVGHALTQQVNDVQARR